MLPAEDQRNHHYHLVMLNRRAASGALGARSMVGVRVTLIICSELLALPGLADQSA
jgi:hypothetical protein